MGGGRGAGGERRMEGFAAAIEELDVFKVSQLQSKLQTRLTRAVLVERRMPKVGRRHTAAAGNSTFLRKMEG